MTRRSFYLIFLILFLTNSAFALKVENIPLVSDFHVGLVSGIGIGISIGADALLSYRRLRFGLEVEQLMTDVNYSASIHATRFGGVVGYALSDVLKVNYHMGTFNFISSQFFQYRDANGGFYTVDEAVNYKGAYWALSLDYYAWDFLFSPKFVLNSINNQGIVREVDFNISKSF